LCELGGGHKHAVHQDEETFETVVECGVCGIEIERRGPDCW
jgi:hypothetical protein